MEFLKEILGDELYAQVESKINEHNGNDSNKDKQVKLGNLGLGAFIGKEEYNELSRQLDGKQSELDAANALIAETKLKSALKVALMSENAADVDYLTYKLESKLKSDNKTLELDENGNIKGWSDIAAGLKNQFPSQFKGNETKNIEELKLPEGSAGTDVQPKTLAEALEMEYEQKG